MERKAIVLIFTITTLLIVTLLTALNSLTFGSSTTVVEVLHEEQRVGRLELETWPNWASVSQKTYTVLFLTYKRTDILGRVLATSHLWTVSSLFGMMWMNPLYPSISPTTIVQKNYSLKDPLLTV